MIVPDKIIRSARKTLSVSVDCFGNVTVRAPHTCSEQRIFSFLREKERWILRKKSQTQGAGMALPSENLDEYRFLLLGKMHTVRLHEGAKIRLQDDVLYIPKERSKERLTAWLKQNAKRIFTRVVQEASVRMGVQVCSVRVSSAKTRWGSCSGKNAISFSFRLLYAPKETVEYVVIHELAHVRHKDHSKQFWSEVERYMPEWKTHRKWLKDHAYLMQIF